MLSIKRRFIAAVLAQVLAMALLGVMAARTAVDERRLVGHIDTARDVQIGLQTDRKSVV